MGRLFRQAWCRQLVLLRLSLKEACFQLSLELTLVVLRVGSRNYTAYLHHSVIEAKLT